MSKEPTAARESFGDIAPALAEITDKVLFGDVWQRSGLSPRDRSLVTITSLITLYRANELPFHLKKALENGVTRDEIRDDYAPRLLLGLANGHDGASDRQARLRRSRRLTGPAKPGEGRTLCDLRTALSVTDPFKEDRP